MCHVATLFQKWFGIIKQLWFGIIKQLWFGIIKQLLFGIIKQLLHLGEGDMTICSPSTDYIALWLRPQAILPASGKQIVMSTSLKGNICILFFPHL